MLHFCSSAAIELYSQRLAKSFIYCITCPGCRSRDSPSPTSPINSYLEVPVVHRAAVWSIATINSILVHFVVAFYYFVVVAQLGRHCC